MHARSILVFAATAAGILACIPDPDGDFEDYAERTNAFATPTGDGGGNFDSSVPVEPFERVYYGACLSQLAFSNMKRVFNFYTEVKFAPEPGSGGRMSLTLQALRLSPEQGPPATVSKAGLSGEKKDVPATTSNVAADGRYTVELGRVTVPGDSNPITGRDVIIDAASLKGLLGRDRFCARLNGNVTQPIELTLEPERNICQFVPVNDGDPTPTFQQSDFEAGACPF